MKSVYMPFTQLPESTARALAALVGPVVVYQPLATRVADSLTSLASQGLIEIRSPLSGDEARLDAALAEFTLWAAQNPGRTTPGAGFIGSQQGKVPFFDENAINRLRSEIKHHGTLPEVSNAEEAGFSARLFLAVAEENDRTTANLDQDLEQFKSLEQGFLESLGDSDGIDFRRRALASETWQEDPGLKHTEQRMRAWATLAAADGKLPDLLITTSAAVVDAFIETGDDAIPLERLQSITLSVPSPGQPPLLDAALIDLATRPSLAADDCDVLAALKQEETGRSIVTVTVYGAIGHSAMSVVRQMAPAALALPEENASPKEARRCLILLVEFEPEFD